MSRGFGRWERELVSATAGVCVVPVGGLVKAIVPEPSRSDFTSARRATRSLAVKRQVTAFYCWSCQRCGHVQDRPGPARCCGTVRSSLAVARPGRMLPHPAPAPAGTAPPWIMLSATHPAPAGLAAPTLDDLAALAMRRLWERLEAGTIAVSPADAAALVRLAREAGRADLRSAPGHSDEAWRLALREVLWAARSRLRDDWPSFVADLRSNEVLKGLWPRPGPGP